MSRYLTPMPYSLEAAILSKNLVRIRELLGWSRENLAAALGLGATASIYSYENGDLKAMMYLALMKIIEDEVAILRSEGRENKVTAAAVERLLPKNLFGVFAARLIGEEKDRYNEPHIVAAIKLIEDGRVISSCLRLLDTRGVTVDMVLAGREILCWRYRRKTIGPDIETLRVHMGDYLIMEQDGHFYSRREDAFLRDYSPLPLKRGGRL